ncbi:MnmC family methyltransferase [Escherichia coli]
MKSHVTLDLWFGDINELTSQLDNSLNQKVMPGFWTGFAPAKNRICGRKISDAMARLARPGGALATFRLPVLSAAVCRTPDSRCKNVRAFGAKTGKCSAG